MAASEQQDAHEFLVALLDGLSLHLQQYHGVSCTVKQHFMAPPITESSETQTSDINSVTDSLSPIRSDTVKTDVASDGHTSTDALKINGVDVTAFFSTGNFRFHGIINEVLIMDILIYDLHGYLDFFWSYEIGFMLQ